MTPGLYLIFASYSQSLVDSIYIINKNKITRINAKIHSTLHVTLKDREKSKKIF